MADDRLNADADENVSYARFAGRPSKDGGLESSRDILIGVSIQAVVGHAPR
jgi:hypothetical protein